MRESRGFTVLELIVSMSILTLIAGFAIPSFNSLFELIRIMSAETEVTQDMRRAQATTVQEGCQGIITIAEGGNSYTFGCDYIPFSSDPNPAIEQVKFIRNLPERIVVAADATIVFNTRGQVIAPSGDLDMRTITMSLQQGGTLTQFNQGTLRPTGFFSLEN